MNLKQNKPLLAGIGLAGLAAIAWLAFGFFGIQAAFIDNEVSETTDGLFDEAAAPATSAEPTSTDTDEGEAMEDEAEAMADDAEEGEAMADDADAMADEAMEDEAEEPAEPVTNEIVTIASGEFSSLNSYSVNGDALVLNNGTEQRFLRFENFESDNGPDLKVYLRAENGDFVSLGDLSGNIGDQNYEIPVEVDLSEFNRVEIWCERFSRGFGVAELAAP